MQRRTNEWYQGLREASSEEDDEDVILELETTFSSPHDHSHLKKTKNTPSVVKWGAGASNKSPPPLRSSGGKGLLGTKSSPTPPVKYSWRVGERACPVSLVVRILQIQNWGVP